MNAIDTSRPFRQWLKQQRKYSGLTQQQLADQLSCTVSLVRKLESGARTPSLLIARKIAQTFQIDSTEYPLFISWSVQAPDAPATMPVQVPYPTSESLPPAPAILAGTPLIGRQQDVDWIEMFFREDQGRILTLVGPAGIGKTSLALNVARRFQKYFKVVQIDLDTVESSDRVLMTISQKLGFGGTSEAVIQSAFQHMLGDDPLLLVLDTFEHILEAAASIQAILTWCPKLMLLVTSQAPLRIYEERIYQVAPLSLPSLIVSKLSELEQSQAGALLLERLREQRPSWNLNDTHAVDLAHICCYVDGLPLALELVASRLRDLLPKQLLMYLEIDFALVQQSAPTIPKHRQNLTYAIERSFDLLPPAVQQLFCCLSVFADGWSLEDVFQIYTLLPVHQQLRYHEFVAQIELLLERGLMLPLPTNVERFRMLRVLRLFGQHMLQQAQPELEQLLHASHSSYYIQKTEILNSQTQDATWMHQMADMLPNCLVALQWNIRHGLGDQAAQLALNYSAYWYRTETWREAHYWFEQIYCLPIQDQSLALNVARWYANLCTLLRDYQTALKVLFPVVDTCQRIQDWRGLVAALNSVGAVCKRLGYYLEARRFWHSMVVLADMYVPDMRLAAYHNLAVLAKDEGFYQEAIDIHLKLYQEIQQSAHSWMICQLWLNLSFVYVASGQESLAVWAVQQVESCNQFLNSQRFEQGARLVKISISLSQNHLSEALQLARQLLAISPHAQDYMGLFTSMLLCAQVLHAFHMWDSCLLVVAALNHWSNVGLVVFDSFERQQLISLTEQLNHVVPPAQVAAIFQQGATLTVEQILTLLNTALTELDQAPSSIS